MSRTLRLRLLYLLVLAWVGALVVLPNVLLLLMSVWTSDEGAVVHDWTLENYERALGSGPFRVLLLRTLLTAVGAAAIASLVAFPLAYFVWRRAGRWKTAIVLLMIVPLWISYLVRIFAWRIILGENGVLNSLLLNLNLLQEPSSAFLYNRFAVLLTLTYVSIPFVFVSVYAALERIPPHLVEAAGDAGASAWQTFRTVVLPLSIQGLALGFALALLIAVGDYITPQLVGGLDGTMVGSVIEQQFGLTANWSFGAAMAFTLLAVVIVLLATLGALVRRRAVPLET